MQGAPAQVDVGVVVHLLGHVGDRHDRRDRIPEARQLHRATQAVPVPGPQGEAVQGGGEFVG